MKRPIPFPGGGGAGNPGDPLDALLGRLPEPVVPNNLPARTLAQVRVEAALDQLIERGLPAASPAGLAQRVLARLADEHQLEPRPTAETPPSRAGAPVATVSNRSAGRPSAGHAPRRFPRLVPWMSVAAAACLLVGWMVFERPWNGARGEHTELAQAPLEGEKSDALQGVTVPTKTNLQPAVSGGGGVEAPLAELTPLGDSPDAELLEVLDLLENWETLTDPAVLALEIEAEAAWWDELEAVLEGSGAAEDSDEG